MPSCPACGAANEGGALECPACGIVIAKYRPRQARPPRPPAAAAVIGVAGAGRSASASSPHRLAILLLVGLLGGAAVAGGYWWLEIRPRVALIEDPLSVARPSRVGTIEARVDSVADFDRELQLPGDPIGAVAVGGVLLVGNREDPWGFLRLEPAGDDAFRVEKVPVIERRYAQKVGFHAVTWNGEQVVALTDGSWVQRSEPSVFVLLQGDDLRIDRTVPAPPGLGCLEWDGSSYWASTRRNTRDADEPVHLYRLDRDFRVISEHDPPGVGCQGLAWDGRHLWFGDVFDDAVHVLSIDAGEPRLVHSQPVRFEYVSGIAHFDGHLWISEYGDDRLYRLNERFRQAWARGVARQPMERVEMGGSRGRAVERVELEASEIARLRHDLRDADSIVRDRAERELRRAGAAIDYAVDEDRFAPHPVPDEDFTIDRWSIELRDGKLLGSWELRFGAGLFESEERIRLFGPVGLPAFARFMVTVEGGTLSRPMELEIEALPGENRATDKVLVSRLGPGIYRADLFVHVQFVTSEGSGQILNRSAMTLEVEQR